MDEPRVSDLMSPDPDTVEPETTLHAVLQRMNASGRRQFPVMSGGRLVGIVTDRDLRLAVSSPVLPEADARDRAGALDALRVAECMTPDPLTVPPDMLAAEAAGLLALHKFGSLPVVDHGDRLVGILTTVDFLEHVAGSESS